MQKLHYPSPKLQGYLGQRGHKLQPGSCWKFVFSHQTDDFSQRVKHHISCLHNSTSSLSHGHYNTLLRTHSPGECILLCIHAMPSFLVFQVSSHGPIKKIKSYSAETRQLFASWPRRGVTKPCWREYISWNRLWKMIRSKSYNGKKIDYEVDLHPGTKCILHDGPNSRGHSTHKCEWFKMHPHISIIAILVYNKIMFHWICPWGQKWNTHWTGILYEFDQSSCTNWCMSLSNSKFESVSNLLHTFLSFRFRLTIQFVEYCTYTDCWKDVYECSLMNSIDSSLQDYTSSNLY